MATAQPILVVRNTFLDIEEEEEEAEVRSSSKRSSSAPRSWKPTTSDDSPAASTAASVVGSDDETDGGQVSDSIRSSGAVSGQASRAWADAEDDSDEEFFASVPRRWSSPQQCSMPFEPSPRRPEQAAYWGPSNASAHLSWSMQVEQQAAEAAAPLPSVVAPSVRTPLRSKLSGAAQSFHPSRASFVTQMPLAMFEAPPAPPLLPVPVSAPAIALGEPPAQDDEPGSAILVDRALRREGAQPSSRNRRRQQWLFKRENKQRQKKQARAGVSPAVGTAISKTEGVASVAVTKTANETSFVVQLKPGHQEVADAVLRAAKAAVMNASALSMGSYVIGYLSQPFEEQPGGFKSSVGIVQRCDEADACWGFYEHGSCPRSSTCHRHHPQEDDLEHIVVTVIA